MPEKEAEQSFDFDTMAVILFCGLTSGVTIGTKHFQMMSAIDGKRSASSFEHQFRKVKARAKELQEQVANGAFEAAVPASNGKKSTLSACASSKSQGTKRGRKAAGDCGKTDTAHDGYEEPLSKRVKKERDDIEDQLV